MEILIIFMILIVLILVISTFGGSVKVNETFYMPPTPTTQDQNQNQQQPQQPQQPEQQQPFNAPQRVPLRSTMPPIQKVQTHRAVRQETVQEQQWSPGNAPQPYILEPFDNTPSYATI